MSETRHTPGPWGVQSRGKEVRQVAGPGRIIAFVRAGQRMTSEDAANAALISFAPDLLAACEALLALATHGDAPEWIRKAADNLGTAGLIARAKGGA